MADRVDSRENSGAEKSGLGTEERNEAFRMAKLNARRESSPAPAQSFVTLLQTIDSLTTRLAGEVEMQFA
jgi:hypothetical protein